MKNTLVYVLFKRQCKYSKQGYPYVTPPKIYGVFTDKEDLEKVIQDIDEPVESYENEEGKVIISTDYFFRKMNLNTLYITNNTIK